MRRRRYRGDVDMDAVDRVLLAAEQVPAGRVASYGLIGRVAGVGPRQVGAIMASHGSFVAWWRITNARGELPPPLLAPARERWAAEGIAVRDDGGGCRYAAHAAPEEELRAAYSRALHAERGG